MGAWGRLGTVVPENVPATGMPGGGATSVATPRHRRRPLRRRRAGMARPSQPLCVGHRPPPRVSSLAAAAVIHLIGPLTALARCRRRGNVLRVRRRRGICRLAAVGSGDRRCSTLRRRRWQPGWGGVPADPPSGGWGSASAWAAASASAASQSALPPSAVLLLPRSAPPRRRLGGGGGGVGRSDPLQLLGPPGSGDGGSDGGGEAPPHSQAWPLGGPATCDGTPAASVPRQPAGPLGARGPLPSPLAVKRRHSESDSPSRPRGAVGVLCRSVAAQRTWRWLPVVRPPPGAPHLPRQVPTKLPSETDGEGNCQDRQVTGSRLAAGGGCPASS